MSIHALLLAAGRSTRMGERNKLRLPLRGRPVVYHACQSFLDAGLNVLVVLGHEADSIKLMLPNSRRVTTVLSPRYAEGLSHSLSIGLRYLPADTKWAMVGLGDMPLVQSTTIARVAGVAATSGMQAVVPTFQGEWGNPVALSYHLIRQGLNLDGDRGAGQVLRQFPNMVETVAVSDEGVVKDIDTPEIYASTSRRLDRY